MGSEREGKKLIEKKRNEKSLDCLQRQGDRLLASRRPSLIMGTPILKKKRKRSGLLLLTSSIHLPMVMRIAVFTQMAARWSRAARNRRRVGGSSLGGTG